MSEARQDTQSPEPADAGLALGRRIFARYFSSPGVSSVPAMRTLAGRIQRFRAGRVPLLTWLQRRWGHSVGLPDDWQAPVYAWPFFAADGDTLPAPFGSGLRTSAAAGIQASVVAPSLQPEPRAPQPKAESAVSRMALTKPAGSKASLGILSSVNESVIRRTIEPDREAISRVHAGQAGSPESPGPAISIDPTSLPGAPVLRNTQVVGQHPASSPGLGIRHDLDIPRQPNPAPLSRKSPVNVQSAPPIQRRRGRAHVSPLQVQSGALSPSLGSEIAPTESRETASPPDPAESAAPRSSVVAGNDLPGSPPDPLRPSQSVTQLPAPSGPPTVPTRVQRELLPPVVQHAAPGLPHLEGATIARAPGMESPARSDVEASADLSPSSSAAPGDPQVVRRSYLGIKIFRQHLWHPGAGVTTRDVRQAGKFPEAPTPRQSDQSGTGWEPPHEAEFSATVAPSLEVLTIQKSEGPARGNQSAAQDVTGEHLPAHRGTPADPAAANTAAQQVTSLALPSGEHLQAETVVSEPTLLTGSPAEPGASVASPSSTPRPGGSARASTQDAAPLIRSWAMALMHRSLAWPLLAESTILRSAAPVTGSREHARLAQLDLQQLPVVPRSRPARATHEPNPHELAISPLINSLSRKPATAHDRGPVPPTRASQAIGGPPFQAFASRSFHPLVNAESLGLSPKLVRGVPMGPAIQRRIVRTGTPDVRSSPTPGGNAGQGGSGTPSSESGTPVGPHLPGRDLSMISPSPATVQRNPLPACHLGPATAMEPRRSELPAHVSSPYPSDQPEGAGHPPATFPEGTSAAGADAGEPAEALTSAPAALSVPHETNTGAPKGFPPATHVLRNLATSDERIGMAPTEAYALELPGHSSSLHPSSQPEVAGNPSATFRSGSSAPGTDIGGPLTDARASRHTTVSLPHEPDTDTRKEPSAVHVQRNLATTGEQIGRAHLNAPGLDRGTPDSTRLAADLRSSIAGGEYPATPRTVEHGVETAAQAWRHSEPLGTAQRTSSAAGERIGRAQVVMPGSETGTPGSAGFLADLHSRASGDEYPAVPPTVEHGVETAAQVWRHSGSFGTAQRTSSAAGERIGRAQVVMPGSETGTPGSAGLLADLHSRASGDEYPAVPPTVEHGVETAAQVWHHSGPFGTAQRTSSAAGERIGRAQVVMPGSETGTPGSAPLMADLHSRISGDEYPAAPPTVEHGVETVAQVWRHPGPFGTAQRTSSAAAGPLGDTDFSDVEPFAPVWRRAPAAYHSPLHGFHPVPGRNLGLAIHRRLISSGAGGFFYSPESSADGNGGSRDISGSQKIERVRANPAPMDTSGVAQRTPANLLFRTPGLPALQTYVQAQSPASAPAAGAGFVPSLPSAGPSSPSPSSATNVDLPHLADQVYQLLVRRLSRERERRGI